VYRIDRPLWKAISLREIGSSAAEGGVEIDSRGQEIRPR
jgi:hypothetical protein